MSTANTHDIGDVVRITGSFVSTASTAVNPNKVTIKYEDPSGNVATVTSTSTSMANPAVGTFTTDVAIDEHGVWEYRIYSTGNVITSTEGWWRVRKQRVT